MDHWLRHLRWREWRFLILVCANLTAIAGFLGSGIQGGGEQIGGWRRIQLDPLMDRVRSGDLNSREASWYQPLPEGAERR